MKNKSKLVKLCFSKNNKKNNFATLRLMLSDELWPKLRLILLQEGIYDNRNLRRSVEGMLYRMRAGCPWRDLPKQFGHWNSLFRRFKYWSKSGKWLRIFAALSQKSDTEWEFIDGTYVRAHQHSAGASGQRDEGIGESCGGNTSKIHMAVDSYGLPIAFKVTGGEVSDCTVAPEFLEALPPAEVIVADRGYDSQQVRQQIEKKGAKAVIPRKKNSLIGNDSMDWYLYGLRHLVENIFARLKHFRAVATRYDKLKRNYESTVAMACGFLCLPR